MRRLGLAWFVFFSGCLGGDTLTIGTTTTTQDTGLLDVLLPAFEKESAIRVRAVVGGTGEMIEKGKRADVDVLLTHSPAREMALVDAGTATSRKPVMFNLFLIVGVDDDPAGIREAGDAVDAFRRIHDNRSTFLSRGDMSGTHDKELGIWKSAGLDPKTFAREWYKETGTGQGATLLVASQFDAYMLVDEGTLLQFHAQRKATNLIRLLSGDPVLRNQYAVTQLEPSALPAPIQTKWAERFSDWITGPTGQAVIGSYRTGGHQVFTPSANEAGA